MKKLMLLLLVMFVMAPVYAQQEHEVKSEISELTQFHDVIYPIWHSAWPEKNIEMLKSFVPDVEKGYQKIASAKLPGILRDKKVKWEEGVKKFGATVDAYKEASKKDDNQALLDAAEKLHMQYEALVRVVKPVLKEVDAFHQELYLVYHYYSPEYNFEKLKSSAAVLKTKMVDLMNAKLSTKMQPRQEKFDLARTNLNIAVLKLNEIIANGDNKDEITKAVDGMHSKYEELEKVFD